MNRLKIFIFVFWIFYIVSAVYSFSIDEINQSLSWSYDIDLHWDKIDYRFSKQSQLKKDNNWGFLNIWNDSFIDSDENLNLNNIPETNLEDNSQQWESQEEYDSSIIPINYYEKKKEDIENNIIRKKTSFKMEDYEEWTIKIRNRLQRYYNSDLESVLIWWVPSSFWFWKNSFIVSSPTDQLINQPTTNNNVDCAKTCNCGQWYFAFGVCKKIPTNSYSTWNWFKCYKWYTRDSTWTKCIASQTSSSKYKWISNSDDPYGVKVKSSNSSYSSINLWLNNASYQTWNYLEEFEKDRYSNILNSSSVYNNTLNPNSTWEGSTFKIKSESILYDIPIR